MSGVYSAEAMIIGGAGRGERVEGYVYIPTGGDVGLCTRCCPARKYI